MIARIFFRVCLISIIVALSVVTTVYAVTAEDIAESIDAGNVDNLKVELATYSGDFYLNSNESLLQLGIKIGSVEILNLLIEAGADVNGATKGFRKKSHLHLAVETGNTALASTLIDSKANIEAVDKQEQTPLIYAIVREDISMIDLLIDSGASTQTNSDGGENLLLMAMVNSPSARVTEQLFNKGLTIDTESIVNKMCINCHNADGQTRWEKAVNIAGQNRAYLEKQLMDLKNGQRIFDNMQKYGETLPESVVIRLAEYYANQKPAKAIPDVTFGNVEFGKSIFFNGLPAKGISSCVSCHGDDSGPIDGSIPWIRGMHANYIYTQLKNYQSGKRSNDDDRAMRAISEKLAESEMRDLAAFLSTI